MVGFADLWVSDGTEEGLNWSKIYGRDGTTFAVAKSSIMLVSAIC